MPAAHFRRKVYNIEATQLERGTSYTTSDLYLAAYLFCCAAKLVSTSRHGRSVHFVFEAPNMLALRQAWHDGTGAVVGSAYADACRNLKQLVFSR